MAADRFLDAMYHPTLRVSEAYRSLREKARAFIKRHPLLLATGWVHPDSCVCQVMEELRVETSQAERILSKFRLQPPV